MTSLGHVTTLLAAILILVSCLPWVQSIDEEEIMKDPWFHTDLLPDVDLEELVANLSLEIPWFKYIGEIALTCSQHATEQDTLQLALEALLACLRVQYEACASDFATQPTCDQVTYEIQPCGKLRFGRGALYSSYESCKWHIQVPDNFKVNLTFDMFNVEYGGEDCIYDSVTVYDGGNTSVAQLGRFCGRRTIFSLYSSSDEIVIEVETDRSINKAGFKAVYQVLIEGYGVRYSKPVVLRELSGTIKLTDYSPTLYEVYLFGYNYYQWYLRLDYAYLARIETDVVPDVNAKLLIYDGTEHWGGLLGNYSYEKYQLTNKTRHVIESTITNTIYIVLLRPTTDDNTQMTINYRNVPRDPNVDHWRQHKPNLKDECIGEAYINLREDEEVLLSLRNQSRDGVPLQCAWVITAPPGFHVLLNVKKLQFNGPNTEGCLQKGLLVSDGPTLDPQYPRYGPFCQDDLRGSGMFSNLGGYNNLTTSGDSMVVFFYSYMDNNSTKGSFKAYVRATPCKGYVNPCLMPPGYTRSSFSTIFINKTDNEVDVNFSCKKTKCCALHQLPAYGEASFATCRIHAAVEGTSALATTRFLSGIALPPKPDTQFEYGCETHENISMLNYGGHTRKCLGTKAFLSASSTSKFSQVAFFINIAPAECGYYHPNVHSDNFLFPPCARADFPLVENARTNYSVHYYDPVFNNESYYRFSYDYKNPENCGKGCFNDTINLSGPALHLTWKTPQVVPLVWHGWGMSYPGRNWSRDLHVMRDAKTCDASKSVEDCQMVVKFQQIPVDPMEDRQLSCAEGYTAMGWSCYKLIINQEKKPLEEEASASIMTTSMSWNEANATCRNSSGHLVDITSKIEMEGIRQLLFYKWWQDVLKFIPGFKYIHVGLHRALESKGFSWMTGRVMPFVKWTLPDYQHRYPEKAWSENDTAYKPTGLSKLIAELAQQPHPVIADNHDCVLMQVLSPHEGDATWMTVPCSESIPAGLAICEAEPVSSSIDHKKENNETFKFDCPLPYVHYNGLCLMVFRNSRTSKSENDSDSGNLEFVQKDTLKTGCKAPAKGDKLDHHLLGTKGYPKQMIEDDLDLISGFLNMVGFNPDLGWIRVLNGSDPDNTTDDCSYLSGENVNEDDGTKPVGDWQLHPLNPCREWDNDTRPLYYYICEIEPRPIGDRCRDNQFTCPDGACIVDHHRCDGHFDCEDGLDEKFCSDTCDFLIGLNGNCATECHKNNCTCSPLFFQCKSGGCRPISKVCDYKQDCPDNSDEDACAFTPCPKTYFRCKNTECVPMSSRCDQKADCRDGSDEDGCFHPKNGCPIEGNTAALENNHFCVRSENASDSGKCYLVPRSLVDDGVIDCPGPNPSDELLYISMHENAIPTEDGALILGPPADCNFDGMSCDMYFPSCYPKGLRCVYGVNRYNHVTPCRKGQHLYDCKDYQCSGMFKCHDSYCLPVNRVCDGFVDCESGEDEAACDKYTCPGMLKCRNSSSCVRQVDLCDGVVHCPLMEDDEALCHLLQYGCPEMCTCFGSAINCEDRNLTTLPENLDPETRSLILSHNVMQYTPIVTQFHKLYRLDLSYNFITTIEVGSFDHENNGNVMLRELYLHYNKIDTIQQDSMAGLVNLVILTLYGNSISHLDQKTLTGLRSLPTLDLRGQQIRTVEDFTFSDLHNLKNLDLSNNIIKEINNDTFSVHRGGKVRGLDKLLLLDIRGNSIEEAQAGVFRHLNPNTFLKTDRFKFCCLAPQLKRCNPAPDEFTSCQNLVENSGLRAAMWALSLMSLIGNAVILCQRLKSSRNTVPSLLIQHLSISDFMMGCYLLIIVCTDVHFRGNFIANTDDWRPNVLCKLAGFMNMTSVIMGTFVVLMIAMDRLFATASCIKRKGLGLRITRGILALIWTVSVVVAILPVLEFDYFEAAKHDQNNICLSYNLFRGSEMSGWDFTVAMFVFGNLACYLISALSYAVSWRVVTDPKAALHIKADDTMTEEERDTELEFRTNELLITKRLMLMTTTKIFIWLYIGVTVCVSVMGYRISSITSGWIVLFAIPLNSALNPYLYTFSRTPFKGHTDELLLNWQEDQDDDDDLIGGTDAANSTTNRSDADGPEHYQDAVLREMM